MAELTPHQSINGNSNQQAGRDIYNYPQTNSKMKELIKAYEQQCQNNETYNDLVEELNYFLNPVKNEAKKVIGLEQKLHNGKFDELMDFACEMKDKFSRKIEKHRLSKAAQEIFVYVLAEVMNLFQYKIYPYICAGNTHVLINEKIQDEIIDVITRKLEDNILDIYADSISGMIYFLTGNCHIKWSKE
jgi:hypothetical protein